jgi:hypothetical protein
MMKSKLNELIVLLTESYPLSLYIGLGVALLFFASVLIIKIYRAKKYKFKDLKQNGFFREEVVEVKGKNGVAEKKVKTSISLTIKKDRIVFYKYNRKMDLNSFKEKKELLEHIFGVKFFEIVSSKRIFGQPKIFLYLERFPKISGIDDIKAPSKGSFLIGFDGKGKEIYQSVYDGENTLLVVGQKGSGKSNSVNVALESFFKNDYHSDHFDLLIFDHKLNDFLRWKNRSGVEIFDTSDLESFKKGVEILEGKLDGWLKFKKEMLDREIVMANFLDYDGDKNKHLIVVIDEASQVLSSRTLKKPAKDAGAKENENYEKYLLERRLIALVDYIGETQRYLSNFLILASQSSRQMDYGIKFTNLKSILASKDTSVQSSNLTGDSKILMQTDLHGGRFIYISNGRIVKVQVPFLPLDGGEK